MTAQHLLVDPTRSSIDDPLCVAADPVEAARAHVMRGALTESTRERVGLELELHLVDVARPARRPTWADVTSLAADLPAMPAGSSVTFEPGGQVELSTPPTDGAHLAVVALQQDRAALRAALRYLGYSAAPLVTDPARAVRRVNPSPRYVAMERHFDALGCARAGKAMMCATAALQVNVDAGPATGWADRLALLRSLVPVLVAASSTSPYLGGGSSGWHSMRQGTWRGIDRARSDPFSVGEPTAAWAFYALSAPVMLVREGDHVRPVTHRVSFVAWLRGDASFGRRPTLADLDYHLTTLFPPVRPRGYVEIRCLDALPDRWWPAMATMTATLLDDPVAADVAAELAQPVADAWRTAARDGLADPAVRRAVAGCAEVAARRCPEPLRAEVETLAEMYADGRSPCDELRSIVDQQGPLRLLEAAADA